MDVIQKKSEHSTDKCFFCDNKYNDTKTKRHSEHIIQNSIAGKLTSEKVLCESCGGKLSVSIDTPFGVEMSIFNILHNTDRDRDSKSTAKIDALTKAKPHSPAENINYRLTDDYRILPDRPVYFIDDTKTTITIVASTEKQAQAFSKSSTIENFRKEGYKIQIQEDIGEYTEKSILRIDPHSNAIIRAAAKIALEYAVDCGVDYRYLLKFKKSLLDFTPSSEISDLVTQYYPTTDDEKIYETKKYAHEDWHPNHQITLFSDGSELYCYVELYGAIQKYVHLSSNYGGEKIIERFTQRVTSWNFDPKAWTGGPREIHMFARQFGITTTDRKLEDIEKEIANKARSRSYTLESDIQIEKVKKIMQALAHYLIADIKGIPSVDELRDKSTEADELFGLSVMTHLKANPFMALSLLNKNYNDFRIKSNKNSSPKIAKTIHSDNLKKYARFKLYESLCCANQEHNIFIEGLETGLDNLVK